VEEHPYTSGATDLTLNYGTAVTPNDATTLVRTSEFAYLDTDRSGSLDDDENLSRYPVVTIESVGDGQVITVGDPSIFINAMLDQNGNTAFATALMQAHEQVIFDYSQSDSQPPLAVALLIFRETLLLQMLVGVVGVGLSWRMLTQPGGLSRLRDQVVALLPGLSNPAETIGDMNEPLKRPPSLKRNFWRTFAKIISRVGRRSIAPNFSRRYRRGASNYR